MRWLFAWRRSRGVATSSAMARSKLILVGGLLMTIAATGRGEAATFTFTPAADAHVASAYPTTNYASATRIIADASPLTQSMIRFSVSGISGTVTSARVRLFVSDPSGDGPA